MVLHDGDSISTLVLWWLQWGSRGFLERIYDVEVLVFGYMVMVLFIARFHVVVLVGIAVGSRENTIVCCK